MYQTYATRSKAGDFFLFPENISLQKLNTSNLIFTFAQNVHILFPVTISGAFEASATKTSPFPVPPCTSTEASYGFPGIRFCSIL